jgi:hypothetical protein
MTGSEGLAMTGSEVLAMTEGLAPMESGQLQECQKSIAREIKIKQHTIGQGGKERWLKVWLTH